MWRFREERLAELPIGGVPDELLLNVRYLEDQSVLDREHAGCVPVDIGDAVSDEEEMEEMELGEVADGEEREMEVDDERLPVQPDDEHAQGDGEDYVDRKTPDDQTMRGGRQTLRRALPEPVQPHECKPFTCLKLRKGRLVCKRRAPWRTATDDWVTETGDWGPKRLYSKLNAWNPALLQVTRCNQDMKLVTNGGETKDITFYITLYIAKRQIQAANASALLAKGTAFQARYQGQAADNLKRNKRLLQRCTNTLSRQHEFSAPEVVSYLMGWGDRFISHSFVKIYWDSITAHLRRTFPNLVVGGVSRGKIAAKHVLI
ncbi:ATP-dependent DNA helicase [Mycena chlorophos]|uniref:ATP-dependent DNA helicase n=1 Tax=Mycena chlorophos TaxID=658473 RepID=A0A8H6WKH3_MYCCL|nr:ATP-dependent DNA helicase [Mycena chlorophos]